MMGNELGAYLEAVKIPAVLLAAWVAINSALKLLFPGIWVVSAQEGGAMMAGSIESLICIVGSAVTIASGYMAGKSTAIKLGGGYGQAAVATLIMALISNFVGLLFALLSFLRMQSTLAAAGLESVGIAVIFFSIPLGVAMNWAGLAACAFIGVYINRKV